MEGISTNASKCESLKFYSYLCEKVGSEEVVKIRRLAFIINDMGQGFGYGTITSGSNGEGLDLKGSDLDIMVIYNIFKVYESEKEVVYDSLPFPLVMNTEETQSCFTLLCNLYGNFWPFGFNAISYWQTHPLVCMLSSEQYRQFNMHISNLRLAELKLPSIAKIHGPCLSSFDDELDTVLCLKCDQWICQVQPWVRRPRTAWPSPEIISKIIYCGVLFVPIRCKGSVNEDLEWRISFSVAEKFLVYSFSHAQFLCYGLLKILLKEIIEKHEDLKGLLCSYFLKTLMFWISEETDPNLWRPDNIIPCFMACVQRLLYCVRYSILLHYFIPDNNFFYSRFTVMNKQTLETILSNLYERGIDCFASSETLKDFQRKHYMPTHPFTQKYTDEKIFTGSVFTKHEFTFIQKHVLNLMKTENFYTVLRSLKIETLMFGPKSAIIPEELQLDNTWTYTSYHPLPFAYFLGFLCNYHLNNIPSCICFIKQLLLTMITDSVHVNFPTVNTRIMCGIAHQLMVQTSMAKIFFREAASVDKYKVTSAATRLSRVT
ncbi:Hypothetical predicted protein [Mytilus galloprovincialis]|uniref:Mab-21-like HhH/H2TH-like domain-containing protein n=1 Tax=Mytilus galloprovincialis TaxID=29158 RepID=A0A8B6H4J9_MYTGA|nr:Hypothetical predicted protein [Mytilus galloprovincialis]